jgi:hypothetical protein
MDPERFPDGWRESQVKVESDNGRLHDMLLFNQDH